MKPLFFILFIIVPFFISAQDCDDFPLFELEPSSACLEDLPVVLHASPNYSGYLWDNGSTDSVFTVYSSGVYSCQVITGIAGNIVVNGDFEQGSQYFTSDYADSTNGGQGNDGNGLGMWNEEVFAVGSNPYNYHTGFSTCGDHTSGSGNMLLLNGSSNTDKRVWCQNINIESKVDYMFSASLASIHPTSPAVLTFTINGVAIGSTFGATETTCEWQTFTETWYNAHEMSVEICIQNQNPEPSGNDFAIDDIFFGAICKQTNAVVVTDTTITETASSLTSNQFNADEYQWYDCDSNQPVPNETSQTFTPSQSGNYSVFITNGDCTDMSECYSVTTTTGINTNSIENDFIIYPNPIIANKDFTLKGSFNKNDIITISDVNGKVIFENTVLNNQKELQITIVDNGVYFIQHIGNNTNNVKKVIVTN